VALEQYAKHSQFIELSSKTTMLVLGSFPTTISDLAPALASMSFFLPTCDNFFIRMPETMFGSQCMVYLGFFYHTICFSVSTLRFIVELHSDVGPKAKRTTQKSASGTLPILADSDIQFRYAILYYQRFSSHQKKCMSTMGKRTRLKARGRINGIWRLVIANITMTLLHDFPSPSVAQVRKIRM
jgi:hypothetical protein